MWTRLRMRRRFQSTPSGGKATSLSTIVQRRLTCFNPRLPGGRRRVRRWGCRARRRVSIHAFRGEGDCRVDQFADFDLVSIHAFRGEGDPRAELELIAYHRFNPRLPGGRRRVHVSIRRIAPEFQSTPSGGKATWALVQRYPDLAGFNPRLPGGRRPA